MKSDTSQAWKLLPLVACDTFSIYAHYRLDLKNSRGKLKSRTDSYRGLTLVFGVN
jgi:hypothetical protein